MKGGRKRRIFRRRNFRRDYITFQDEKFEILFEYGFYAKNYNFTRGAQDETEDTRQPRQIQFVRSLGIVFRQSYMYVEMRGMIF